ncbi:MAG: hypothetical protein E6868_08535 [Pantoea sp.]|uniref:hypothetical protein n=1 Tax=Pantoea sp. TaxID=69393 RepID=UPI0029020143|nr:hypothetical protein [Pantoea sp.]MDU1573284.1 hypothetical protein [Pantoea sp.]
MAKRTQNISNWAIIKDGVVVNVVLWDGNGDIFNNLIMYNLPEGSPVGVGYKAVKSDADGYEFSAPEENQL